MKLFSFAIGCALAITAVGCSDTAAPEKTGTGSPHDVDHHPEYLNGQYDLSQWGNGQYCGAVRAKAESCGLEFTLHNETCTEPDNDEDRCVSTCVAQASCSELTAVACDSAAPGLGACMSDCEPKFTCTDGTEIPASYECDAYQDCTDNSDEHGACPQPYTCSDGEQIPANYYCDGYNDCTDGGDEGTTCPNYEPPFACGDGEEIPASYKCDDYEDCANGADEGPSCPNYQPPFVCGDGSEIQASWVCDDYQDCSDNSDEVGCPGSGGGEEVPGASFVCFDGTEIQGSWECDGYPDCADGDDEDDHCPMTRICGSAM